MEPCSTYQPTQPAQLPAGTAMKGQLATGLLVTPEAWGAGIPAERPVLLLRHLLVEANVHAANASRLAGVFLKPCCSSLQPKSF